jgi:hypothetical protein
MEDLKSVADLAREHGFWGAVVFGGFALYSALTKRWIMMPGMADLQAENASLKAENAGLRALLQSRGIDDTVIP